MNGETEIITAEMIEMNYRRASRRVSTMIMFIALRISATQLQVAGIVGPAPQNLHQIRMEILSAIEQAKQLADYVASYMGSESIRTEYADIEKQRTNLLRVIPLIALPSENGEEKNRMQLLQPKQLFKEQL